MRNKDVLLASIHRVIVTLVVFSVCHFTALSQSYGGFTLYSKMNSTKAYLLDSAGAVYHEWTFPSNRKASYATYMEPGGTLVRSVSGSNSAFFGAAAMSVAVQKVDWDGNVVWYYSYSSADYVLHHDICLMPNGNVLMVAYEKKTTAEVIQAGCTLNNVMWFEKIMEVEPTSATTGNIVWEWRVWDHLCQDADSAKSNYVTDIADHRDRFNVNYKPKRDWMHINSVDYNPELDQIVFTARYLGEVYVIDHSTTTMEAAGATGGNSGKGGRILYRWGNPEAYNVSGTQIIPYAHDAHWIPQGFPYAGHISYFNNKGGVGEKSCVDIILPPYNSYQYNYMPGFPFEPSTYAWRHTYTGSAATYMGGAKPLPNGNFLITIPTSGYIYEVDSADNVVWSVTVGGSVPKAIRYSKPWVEGTLEISPNVKPAVWRLFPNPSTGLFNVEGLHDLTVVIATDLLGRTHQANVLSGYLDLTHLSPGIYFINVPGRRELEGIRVVVSSTPR